MAQNDNNNSFFQRTVNYWTKAIRAKKHRTTEVQAGSQYLSGCSLSFACIVALGSVTMPVNAQSTDWWFDVEVIIFKRNIDGASLNEQFPYTVPNLAINSANDLITPHLYPDISAIKQSLPLCHNTASDISIPLQTHPEFTIDKTLFTPLPEIVRDYSVGSYSVGEYSDGFLSGEHNATTIKENNQEITHSDNDYQALDAVVEQFTDGNDDIADLQAAFAMPEDTPASAQEAPELIPASNETATEINANLTSELEVESRPVLDMVSATDIEQLPLPQHAPMSLMQPHMFMRELNAKLITDNSRTFNFQSINYQQPEQLACTYTNEHYSAEVIERAATINYALAATSLGNDTQYIPSTRPFIDAVPTNLNGNADNNQTLNSKILPRSELKLRKLARDINRQRGLQLMSHFAWRQPVIFGRNKAPSYRLYAGKNYSEDFYYNGLPIPLDDSMSATKGSMITIEENRASQVNTANTPNNTGKIYVGDAQSTSINQNAFTAADTEETIFNNIQAALARLDEQTQATAVNPNDEENTIRAEAAETINVSEFQAADVPESTWELDGLFKVYLQRIGRVNYLHIDSQLNYRQPFIVTSGQLPQWQATSMESATQDNVQKFNDKKNNDSMPPLHMLLTDSYSRGLVMPNTQQSSELISGVSTHMSTDLNDVLPTMTPSANMNNSQPLFLKAYPFNQLRRVISKQIHYFDHPMFGVVVQIRRDRIPDYMN